MVQNRRVLVVDDNVDSAHCLRMLFSKSGCVVQMAHDGLAAVKLAAEFDPELVFLDIGLPKIDGLEACRRIRLLPNGRNMTIVAITGWSEFEDLEESAAAGFTQHLTKPIDLLSLEALLEQSHVKSLT